MRVIRSTTLAAVTVASLLGLAACGSGSDSDNSASGDKSPQPSASSSATTDNSSSADGGTKSGTVAEAIDALNKVEQRADAANSAKVESSMKAGSTMSTESKGSMDWSHGTKAAMSITYTGGSYLDTLKASGVGSTMQARYLTNGYYVNMGDQMAAQLDGKHWIRYLYSDLSQLAGGSGAFLSDQLQNNNPSRSVQYIMASPDVHKVGTEDVRGVQATHYAGTLNVDDVTEQTSTDLSAEELSQLQETLKSAGVTTEKIDMWVSSDSLPVKAVSSAHAATGDTESTTYYSDFGVKVDVAAPPADDFVDFTEMTQQQ
jgi:hypothetical protein